MTGLAQLRAQLHALVSWAAVKAVTTSSRLIARGLEDEDVPWIQHAALKSRPTSGEAVLVNVGGTGDGMVALVVGSRTYPLELAPGEAVLHDEHGNSIHLREDGIRVVSGGSVRVEAEGVVAQADRVQVLSGDVELGTGVGAAVARVGDAVSAGVTMATWIAAVTATLTGTQTPVVAPTDFGAVAAGSSQVTAS